MKQKIDHYGEKEMATLTPTGRGNKRRRINECPTWARNRRKAT